MTMEPAFFDRYPRFRETSRTDTRGQRFAYRHAMLIERHRRLIAGQRVLDLASHDGRWSLAALAADAAHVTGVEGRAELIAHAEESFRVYGVGSERHRFLHGDCLETVRGLEPGQFDVVFCFGFLYHTLAHHELLRAITRLGPRTLLIDSTLIDSDRPAIMLGYDDPALEGAAIPTADGGDRVLVGVPTTKAIELMLADLGWEHHYVDGTQGWTDWDGIEDYRNRRRFTICARREVRR